MFTLGTIGAVLGGLSFALPALGLLTKLKPFRKLIFIGALVLAVVGAGLFGLARLKAYGNERYAAGELAERGQWQAEMHRLTAENEVRRQSDEQKLRAIAINLADEKSKRRDAADTVERQIMELETEDAKAGTANSFDPRVLQLVR